MLLKVNRHGTATDIRPHLEKSKSQNSNQSIYYKVLPEIAKHFSGSCLV
jgi:hypothetical protein